MRIKRELTQIPGVWILRGGAAVCEVFSKDFRSRAQRIFAFIVGSVFFFRSKVKGPVSSAECSLDVKEGGFVALRCFVIKGAFRYFRMYSLGRFPS